MEILPHSPQPATSAEQATMNQAFVTIPRYLEATRRVVAAVAGRMGTEVSKYDSLGLKKA